MKLGLSLLSIVSILALTGIASAEPRSATSIGRTQLVRTTGNRHVAQLREPVKQHLAKGTVPGQRTTQTPRVCLKNPLPCVGALKPVKHTAAAAQKAGK